jgi:hypothetical protein
MIRKWRTNLTHRLRPLSHSFNKSNITMKAIFALFLVATLQAVLGRVAAVLNGVPVTYESWASSETCEGTPTLTQVDTSSAGTCKQEFSRGSYTVSCPEGKTTYLSEDCTGEGFNEKADGMCIKSCNIDGDVCFSSKLSGCGATASGSIHTTGVVQGMGLVGAAALLINY